MSDRKSKGFILPLVVLLTLVLALLFPLLTKLTLSETEKTTRYTQRKGNVDLIQMAEEKAVFFLRKDSSLWDSLQEGHAIPGYNDDVEYAEDQKGFFKVKITSGPAANQITIQIKAVGPSRQFLKTMRAIYGRPQLGSITAENINIEGVASSLFPHAHWAPLYASTIALDPLFLDLHYPRKISKGEVKPADMSSSTPNTNDLDYWAYVDEPFAYPLTPDLPYYLKRAQASSVPVETAGGRILAGMSGNIPAVASPPGSGYFISNNNTDFEGIKMITFSPKTAFPPGYQFDSSTSVIYVDTFFNGVTSTFPNGVTIGTHTFLNIEAFVTTDLNGYFTVYGPGSGVVQATLPTYADLEYQHPSAASVWTTSGSGPSMATVWARPNRCCYEIPNVVIHGMILAQGAPRHVFLGGARPVFVGGITTSWFRSNLPLHGADIYFDEDLARKVRHDGRVYLVSQKEVLDTW